jgi:hypothetical protein
MKDIAEMLIRAERFKADVDKLLERVQVADAGEHRIAATLFLTIAEQFAATVYLVRGGFSSHAPLVMKSMLEALVSLLSLVKDPTHLDQMRFKDASENIKLFSEYAADTEMAQDQDAVKTLMDWKAKAEPVYQELSAKGVKNRKLVEDFKATGLANNYIAYRVYCAYAHNQLTTLLARHAGVPVLRYHEEAPVESTASLLSSAVSILGRAVETLPNYTDADEAEITEFLAALDADWKKFLGD